MCPPTVPFTWDPSVSKIDKVLVLLGLVVQGKGDRPQTIVAIEK